MVRHQQMLLSRPCPGRPLDSNGLKIELGVVAGNMQFYATAGFSTRDS